MKRSVKHSLLSNLDAITSINQNEGQNVKRSKVTEAVTDQRTVATDAKSTKTKPKTGKSKQIVKSVVTDNNNNATRALVYDLAPSINLDLGAKTQKNVQSKQHQQQKLKVIPIIQTRAVKAAKLLGKGKSSKPVEPVDADLLNKIDKLTTTEFLDGRI